MDTNKNTNIESIIAEAVKDKEFVEKVLTAKKLSDAQMLFKEKGIELTEEDMNEIGKYLAKCIKNNGVISDNDLEEISGGSSVIYTITRGIGKVVAAPFMAAGYVAGAAPTGLIRGLVNGARETWIDYRSLD